MVWETGWEVWFGEWFWSEMGVLASVSWNLHDAFLPGESPTIQGWWHEHSDLPDIMPYMCGNS